MSAPPVSGEASSPGWPLGRPLDRVLLRLYVATFLYTLAQAIAIPLVPEFMELDLHAPLLLIGIVVSTYGVMQVVLRLPMGDMADRRGRKPSLLLSFGAALGSGLFLMLATDVWLVVPGVALLGFASGVFWVAANSYLFDRVSGPEVARATSDYSLAVGLAFLVGPALGHIVADVVGFRAAFALYVASSAAGFLVVLTMPETPPEPRPRETTGPYTRALRLLRHPALVASAAGTFLYSLLFSTLTSFFQLHVLGVGLSVATAGLLLSGRQASATLIRYGLPRFLLRLGAARVLLAGLVVAAISTMLVPFATSLPLLIGVSIVAGAATGVMIPANLMLVHEGAPPGQRGLANGIYGTMLGIGSAVAPLVFGAAGDAWGLSWTFWTAGATALALAAVVVASGRLASARPSA